MHQHSARELLDLLQRGEVSSEELTRHFLDRIERLDPQLNSYVNVNAEPALAAARAADDARRRGQGGPLCGLPIAHKDIFCTRGQRTSCGSKMLHNFFPPYDATIVQRLATAGAVCLGKTNMDEFAMGSSNETSYFGPVRNPWATDCVPGGSSGGSAAAVAAGLAAAATGSDTGGSIRQPAALTGLTGLKPTYGRVSRYGMIAFASSLDQAGPMAHSAEDAALLLGAMAGFDPLDSTSEQRDTEDYTTGIDAPIAGLRIGLPREYFSDDLPPAMAALVREAIAEFERQGATVVDISLPHTALAVPCYYVIAPAEASSNLSRYDGVRYGYRCEDPRDLLDLYTRTRAEGFGAEVQRRIMVGTYALSAGFYDAYYRKAQQVRRLIREDFVQAFREVDVIMGPTAPGTAFPLGAKSNDPVTMYLEDIFTIASNLAGVPALSIPCGLIGGKPAGLQLIGRDFDEARLLNVAHRYQLATDWHLQRPRDPRAGGN